jgi:nucleoid DNA-binding protein
MNNGCFKQSFLGGSVTKNDLIIEIVENIGYSRVEAQKIVDDFFEEIKEGLIKENFVKISGFGIFEIAHKKERVGRNPKNKIEAKIEARNVIKFRPSNKLRKKINF